MTIHGLARAASAAGLVLMLCACGGGGDAGADPASVPDPRPAPPQPTPQNRAPVIAGEPDFPVEGITHHPFRFDLATVLSDPDGDPLTVSFGSCPCNAWIHVTGTVLSGTPTDPGLYQMSFHVTDGRGGTANGIANVTIRPNAAPVLVRPLEPMLVAAGAHVNFDATQGGTTFEDPDGDAVTYELEILSPPLGLAVDGVHAVGAMTTVGSVIFKLTARDDYGGSSEDVFSFAAAAPEPGAPTLPATPDSYADDEQPWPRDFARSSTEITPFRDTTPQSGNPVTNAGATLGRVLFYDRRLSVTNTHSCSSCHVQANGFASAEQFDVGVAGTPMNRNAMSLTNVRYNYRNLFFSDQRVEGLETLVLMPIAEPTELGNSLAKLEEKLAATQFYPPLFAAAFGSPEITSDRIARALAQFLRAIVSYRTRFDEAHAEPPPTYYTDPATVFTPLELRGEELFDSADTSCAHCHETNVQLIPRPFNDGLDAVTTDPGAGNGEFRAASLRNIAVTGPYMHDGRFATLREVIDHYDHGVQVGPDTDPFLRGEDGTGRRLNLSEQDKDALEAFLHALTDDALLSDPRFSDPFGN